MVAKTVKEACQLVEAGFGYVCEMDDVKIFRNVNSGLKSEGVFIKKCEGGIRTHEPFQQGCRRKRFKTSANENSTRA